jgi:hypothetical protein
MDKIVAPIKAQDKGSAVANLQQAMLFIVEKRQLTPANRTLASWKDSVSGEIANQFFGQRTLQLLLALLPALHLPGADFITGPVADALNNVLQDLGAFTPPSPTGDQWEYQVISAANATDLINQANTQGTPGWELAGVVVDTSRPDKYIGFLKRKKP